MKTKPSFVLALAAICAGGILGQDASAVEGTAFSFDTTANLFEVCSVAKDTGEYAIANQACRAFIEASVQYHDEVTDRKKLKRLICYPKTATIEEGKLAFLSWARAHSGDPKLMAEQPVVGLVRALSAKYPCAK